MNSRLYINPNWFKGYFVYQGETLIGAQFFDTIEVAEEWIKHVNGLLISIGDKPIKDYTIKYEDHSNEIGPEFIKELRKYL